MTKRRIDFRAVAMAALPHLPSLCARWLPSGRREGNEWVARNPQRIDRRPGSFKVNLVSGKWCDFATGDRGGDVIGLAAYLFCRTQFDAAVELSRMLGLPEGDRT